MPSIDLISIFLFESMLSICERYLQVISDLKQILSNQRSIALPRTDAQFITLVSNKYKSPIDLASNRTDRLTNHLSITKAKAK